MVSSVQCEEGPDSEAEGAFYFKDWYPYFGRMWSGDSNPLCFEADDEDRQVEAAKRATADPLPLAPGQWQGGTENLTGLFPNESSK